MIPYDQEMTLDSGGFLTSIPRHLTTFIGQPHCTAAVILPILEEKRREQQRRYGSFSSYLSLCL